MKFKSFTKHIVLLIATFVFSMPLAFANYGGIAPIPITSLNIQEITYSPVTTNTEQSFSEGLPKSRKAIELAIIDVNDTSTVSNRAVPHINIENYTATLSNPQLSSPCRLVAKVTVQYTGRGNVTTWFEIDEVKTFIYRREYVADSALKFTITLYYVIDDRRVVPDDLNEILSLDTGGATDYYLFYNLEASEVVFFNGTLTENINAASIPFDPEPNTFLIIDKQQPASWTSGFFFENLNTDVLVWVVSMQVGYTPPYTPSPDILYQVGLTITSQNNFKLINENPSGSGGNSFNYTLKLSKDSSLQTIAVDENDLIVVKNIRNNMPKNFNVYAWSEDSTNNLNSGRYKDVLTLNFITDITDSNWNGSGVKEIRLF